MKNQYIPFTTDKKRDVFGFINHYWTGKCWSETNHWNERREANLKVVPKSVVEEDSWSVPSVAGAAIVISALAYVVFMAVSTL